MEMASNATLFEERVKEALKRCQERREPPLIWATEMVKCLDSAGLGLPSVELGQVLVSQLCFAHNSPSMWKFLDHALSSRLLSPLHVLSLLTSRIIPHRWSQPEAYRLYLELLSRYAFSFDPVEPDASKERIIKSVDAALQLSKTYQVHVLELGHTMVLFFFSIVVGLLDSTLDDWGLPVTFLDRASGVARSGDYLNMDIDSKGNKNFKQSEHREQMRRTNSFLAMEVLGTLTENRKAKVLLRLVHLNMPEGFDGLLRRIQFLEAHKLASSILKSANQLLVRLSANIRGVLDFEYQLNKRQLIGMLIDIGSNKLVSGCNFEAVQSACWVPFDIYMENVMDVKQLPVRSTIVILRETIRTLQGFNRASWQETFLALWLSALRLVQRVEISLH